MQSTHRKRPETELESLVGPQPSYPDTAVVFKGDGEPRTPQAMVRKLGDVNARGLIEPDNFSLGGTVEQLEQRFADLLAKEAAVFMPTGTLANHLAIRKHCGIRRRAVVQEQSHIYNDTGDSVPTLSGISLVPLAKDRPYFTLDELGEAVDSSITGRVPNPIGVVIIESPVRRQAGQVMPYTEMEAISGYCKESGLPLHHDGARLYMMSAATEVSVPQYSKLFDTVYVSLYKYFGAPFGAVLAGSADFVGDLYNDRRMFGGGLASASIAAALALEGIERFEERFADAMKRASILFARLNNLPGITVRRFENGSNIFPLELDCSRDFGKFASALRQRSIFIYPDETDSQCAYLAVNTTILRWSVDDLYAAFHDALGSATTQASGLYRDEIGR